MEEHHTPSPQAVAAPEPPTAAERHTDSAAGSDLAAAAEPLTAGAAEPEASAEPAPHVTDAAPHAAEARAASSAPEQTEAAAGSEPAAAAAHDQQPEPKPATATEPHATEPHVAAAEPQPAAEPAAASRPAAEPHAAAEPQPAAAPPATAAAPPESPEPKKDFAEILADFEQEKSGGARPAETGDRGAAGSQASPNVGQKVSGKVVSITEEHVFVDLGAKSEGMIEAAQLRNAEGQLTVKVGDGIDATVTAIDPESGIIVLRKKASGGRGGHQEVATELRQAFQYGMPVEGMVTGINKGGAEVQIYGMRAFCPLSQLDLRYVENPQQFIGQRLKFKVSRIEEGGRNRRPDIVLSRRALLEEEAQAKAAELRARLHVGGVLKGRVTSLTAYGAFVDLGGLEGLLHVSEIGYSRLADPREALTVGQEVEVQVIKIEKGKDEKRPERISLSRRALERDPWRDAADRFPEGSVLPGRVMRLESFGAFVEVAPGLEGLVHVSELGAGRRLNHAKEAVQVGQDVQVRVLNVDPVKRRISLSMAPADERHERADEPAPRESREPREPRESRESREPRETAAAGQQQPGSFGALGDFFKSSGQRRK